MSTASLSSAFKTSPDRMQACELAALILLTVVSCSRQYEEGHPQAVLTLQPAWAQIFTGETVTLSCEVEGGSADWRFKQYRDGREEAGCSDQYRSRYGDSCTISTAQYYHSGEYWCESASGQERSNAVTLTMSNGQVILQTPPQPVFEGDSLTLRCCIRRGYKATRVVFYKDNEELQFQADTELSVDHVSESDEGSYKCTAWWWYKERYKWVESWSHSAEVRVSVRERPQAVLTREPAWTQIYLSERVTLRCQVQGGYTDWRFTWYKAGRTAPVTQDYYSRIDGDRYTISSATRDHSGEYTCKGERRGNPSYSKTSDALTLRVSVDTPKPVLTREPAGEIFEGDTVTLSCVVEGGSGGWRYLWYKDRQGAPVYQTNSSSGTGAGYTISAAALSHSGEYWCGSGRGRNTSYSQYSHPIWVNVTSLFSRVTLTASPGATVKEGEALNLTCEAAVNKTPHPQLHYTIVRDGEPVTNSTDSALYSIASTEKSHTGSYTCAVESQGVKKSSQELHIEVQTSWHSAAAAAGFSVGFFVILLIVFTLLLLYHKIRGFPCITGGKRRERSDQNQDQAAGGVELSSQTQQPDSEDIVYSVIDTSKHNNKKKAKPAETDTVYSAVKISAGKPTADNAESMYATVLPKKKRK
ncbi:Fc receptor-like protein 5 [Acipenser ruthenus]|uniref:Fc receptor-like protein 5 n=1 Tax=Acipenser ruthenus TaxID=7906 RepID=UPI0027406DED|nr:Fc receptor-like protein 5 [Acipenser ruthenus]